MVKLMVPKKRQKKFWQKKYTVSGQKKTIGPGRMLKKIIDLLWVIINDLLWVVFDQGQANCIEKRF